MAEVAVPRRIQVRQVTVPLGQVARTLVRLDLAHAELSAAAIDSRLGCRRFSIRRNWFDVDNVDTFYR